jgi:hypothetical protein
VGLAKRGIAGNVKGVDMDRKEKIVLGLIASTISAFYFMPIVLTHPQQDRCVFGRVSSAEYTELLEGAKAKIKVWGPLFPYELDTNARSSGPEAIRTFTLRTELQKRANEFVNQEKTLDGRVAAMHAFLRAHGALFMRSRLYLNHDNPNFEKDFPKERRRYYDYVLSTQKLGYWLRPIFRWAIVSMTFQNETEPVEVVAFFPEDFASHPLLELDRVESDCPIIQ